MVYTSVVNLPVYAAAECIIENILVLHIKW